MACYQFSLLSLYTMMYFPFLQPRMESGNHSAPSYVVQEKWLAVALPFLIASLGTKKNSGFGFIWSESVVVTSGHRQSQSRSLQSRAWCFGKWYMPVLSSNWDIFENLDLEIEDLTVNQ